MRKNRSERIYVHPDFAEFIKIKKIKSKSKSMRSYTKKLAEENNDEKEQKIQNWKFRF